MNIKNININNIKSYYNNPRKNDKAVDKVANSIKEFGFKQPIVVDKDGIVIVGHSRLKAAKKLGYTEVPVLFADDLTDEQAKAYRLADNKTSEFAEWDIDLLGVELGELKEFEFDMELFGFEDMKENVEVTEDDFDVEANIPDEPITKSGDIWKLGRHRLMCGDSTVITDVEKLMDGKKADMVFTDPPYGIIYQSNMRTKTEKFDVIKNDDIELDIVPIIEMFSVGWVFIWTTWKVINKWIDRTSSLGYPSNMIVWYKGGGGMGDLKKTFSTDYEIALVFNRGAELCGKRIGSVWSIGKDGAGKYMHPTQKPVLLGAEAIDKTTKKCDIVLDLFGGSGSTLIACEQTKRNCYMMELDEKYCDVIIKRWEEITRQKAELIKG